MEGFVNENSPVGTTVTIDKEGKIPLALRVFDADLVRASIKSLRRGHG